MNNDFVKELFVSSITIGLFAKQATLTLVG